MPLETRLDALLQRARVSACRIRSMSRHDGRYRDFSSGTAFEWHANIFQHYHHCSPYQRRLLRALSIRRDSRATIITFIRSTSSRLLYRLFVVRVGDTLCHSGTNLVCVVVVSAELRKVAIGREQVRRCRKFGISGRASRSRESPARLTPLVIPRGTHFTLPPDATTFSSTPFFPSRRFPLTSPSFSPSFSRSSAPF